MKRDVIGMKNIHQEEKIEKKLSRILITDDEIGILGHTRYFWNVNEEKSSHILMVESV